MNKSAKTVMCMVLVSCVSVLCVVSPAAGLVAIRIGASGFDVPWPDDPYLETYDPAANTAQFGNGVNGIRQAGSTFEVTDTINAASIYFEMEDEAVNPPSELGFNLRLYEVDTRFTGRQDVNDGSFLPLPAYGTLLAEGLALPDSSPEFGERVIRFDFLGGVTLEPRGLGGYAIVFSHEGGVPFTGSRTVSNGSQADVDAGADLHGGGSFCYAVNCDGVIQPFAIEIPEPASLALLGLGSGLMMLRRRRR